MRQGRWAWLIPTRRRVVTYLVVILALLVARVALDFWTGHRLGVASSRLAAVYGGLDIASLAPAAVAPSENRARVLAAAASLVIAPEDQRQRLLLTRAVSRAGLDDPATRTAVLEEAVAANRLALAVMDEAELRPKANWEITYADGARMRLPSLLQIRYLSAMSAAAGLLALDHGVPDEAATRARAGLVLAGSLAPESTLIVQLIHVAVAEQQWRLIRETLMRGEPSAASLQALEGPLDDEVRQQPVVNGLTGELKFVNSRLALIADGRATPWDHSGSPPLAGALLLWAIRPAIRFAHARVLDQMHETIEYARLLPFEREARGLRLPSDTPQPWWWRRFGSMFAGGWRQAIRAGDEHHALALLAASSVALRRYRQDRGAYPATLEPLVPAYVARVPIDPFTGGTLNYVQSGKGFELRAKVPPGTSYAELFDWRIPH